MQKSYVISKTKQWFNVQESYIFQEQKILHDFPFGKKSDVVQIMKLIKTISVVYEELPGFTNIALGLIEGTTINKVALQNFAKYLALLHNAWSKLPEDELVELKSKVP